VVFEKVSQSLSSIHIFVPRQVMEKYYEFYKELHFSFIDFRQANDSVSRNELWNGLKLLGIPKKYINLIKICNEKTICNIRFLQNYSELFTVKSGFCHEKALSHTLLKLALEKTVRDTNEYSTCVTGSIRLRPRWLLHP